MVTRLLTDDPLARLVNAAIDGSSDAELFRSAADLTAMRDVRLAPSEIADAELDHLPRPVDEARPAPTSDAEEGNHDFGRFFPNADDDRVRTLDTPPAKQSKVLTRRRRKKANQDALALCFIRENWRVLVPAARSFFSYITVTSSSTLLQSPSHSSPGPAEEKQGAGSDQFDCSSTRSFLRLAKTNSGHFPRFPDWRDLGPKPRIHLYQLALEALGDNRAIHPRLGDVLIQENKAFPESFASRIHERMSRLLNRTLGRDVLYWATIEFDGNKPHLHGAIGVSDSEYRKRARKAILTAVKAEGDFKKYANRDCAVYRGCGVAGYAQKHLTRSRIELGGNNVMVSRRLMQAAEALYITYLQPEMSALRQKAISSLDTAASGLRRS